MGPGSVGLMEFDRNECHLRILACKSPLYFVVADLNAAKDTICILGSLNDCFPVPSDSNQVTCLFTVSHCIPCIQCIPQLMYVALPFHDARV